MQNYRSIQNKLQTRCFYKSSRHFSRPLTDPENKGQRQQGVNFDTLGSWNNRIDMTILLEESIKTGRLIPKVNLNDTSHKSLLGRRKTNEDRSDIRELLPGLQYFAIFDGHGGAFAVDYVHQNLVNHILYWYPRLSSLSEVLTNSFININNLLSRHINTYLIDTDIYNTGTTATVCLLKDSINLVVGHVGDSRAVLCRDGEPIRLSTEDSPEYSEEAKRIKKYGGYIVENSLGQLQVNGRLAMTRSLGDVELEKVGVVATPHIRSIEVKHGRDAFLVLDTDGVNFVLNDHETVNLVSSCPSPKEAASSLVDEALHFGSEDNSTCVVIPFGAWGKYRDADKSMPYSFGRNLLGNRYKYG
ncbi:hypothetical protein LOTGIDRAFT_136567 [Lottia gigantea]|uniref:PPM-type phosphatase domain-containing protein n=1 Tax=Lottia gigantea TaxID=225164 RepID=V4BEL3_LOTGI|nr:hypothetical protein LOTGIDRAFT_136567 [Lottia gigantea]ESP04232.1 hypothetical protein LOTGIDRAFT_136567 [Lottia gigantea]